MRFIAILKAMLKKLVRMMNEAPINMVEVIGEIM